MEWTQCGYNAWCKPAHWTALLSAISPLMSCPVLLLTVNMAWNDDDDAKGDDEEGARFKHHCSVNTIIDIILFTFPDKISGLLCPDTRTCLRSHSLTFKIFNITFIIYIINGNIIISIIVLYQSIMIIIWFVTRLASYLCPDSASSYLPSSGPSLSLSHILSTSSYNQHHYHHHLKRLVFLDMPLSTFCR